jgi:Mn2+/Fe2+ NRAMP family transporter
MDFLKTYWFIAFLISILYFIIKILFIRLTVNTEENNTDNINENKKKYIKDSFLVFIISYFVLSFKDTIFSFNSTKESTHIFTNEPNF